MSLPNQLYANRDAVCFVFAYKSGARVDGDDDTCMGPRYVLYSLSSSLSLSVFASIGNIIGAIAESPAITITRSARSAIASEGTKRGEEFSRAIALCCNFAPV